MENQMFKFAMHKNTCICETVAMQHWPNRASDRSVNWPESLSPSAHLYGRTLAYQRLVSVTLCKHLVYAHRKGQIEHARSVLTNCNKLHTCNMWNTFTSRPSKCMLSKVIYTWKKQQHKWFTSCLTFYEEISDASCLHTALVYTLLQGKLIIHTFKQTNIAPISDSVMLTCHVGQM